MSNELQIRLLGHVEILLDGEPLTSLGTRKAEALLAYLVCQQRPFSRETLAELLWDDRDPQQALANLRSLLSNMRGALKPYLTITRQTIAFNHHSHYRLDVADFQQFAKDGDIIAAEQAIALYRGDFLEGFFLRDSRGFEEWALVERERLQRTAVTLLWQLTNHHSRLGSYTAALPYTNRLLRLDNLSERAHRQKMMLLARTGQLNAALSHYATCRQILADELGVNPAPETQALYQQLVAARDTPVPQLPPSLPHFIGRDKEQAKLLAHLQDPACRLITLLGPGGMGKTRLAVETARHIAANQPGQFLHGIWFVPLAGLSDARLLAPTLADALGVSPAESDDPAAVLIDFLRHREALLLLDNFEQLAVGIDLLARLLHDAPQVKLLVTSQEPLHLQEEWLVDLVGLETPAADAGETAVTASAVQLFLQIGQRLHPSYTPTPADLQAIGQICRLLEGMPLGIELAAVWIRHLPLTQIAAEVAKGLDILSTQLRNVPARHRSLRAIFDYSRQLLPADLQAAFPLLGLFRGAFSAASATAVADATPDQLAMLAEKSLLRRLDDGRFDMHPMLRQYAAELVQRTANPTAAAQRHATYFLDILHHNHPGDQPENRQAIQQAMADIRAAWQWAAVQQQYDYLLQTAVTLHSFYSAQSWFLEGIDAFDFALSHLPSDPQPNAALAQTQAELLGRKARMHIHIGQLDAAKAALDAAQTALQFVQNPARLSAVLGYTAITAYYAGELAQAEQLALQSLALAEDTNDLDGIAFSHNFLGSCAKALGAYGRAMHHFQQSIAVYRQLRDELGEAMTLNNLGNAAQAMGDFAAARQHYQTCSRLFLAHDHLHGASTTLANAGRLAIKQADYAGAQELLAESLKLKRQMGDERGTAVALVGLGDAAVRVGNFAHARTHLVEALTLAHKSGDVKLVLESLAVFGHWYLQQGEGKQAARLLTFVQNHPATTQEVREGMADFTQQVRADEMAAAAAKRPLSLDELVSQLTNANG